MKLYDCFQAPNCRRVRVFLAEKGVRTERQDIDILAGDNLRPEYLAIAPRGLVPVLQLDDGHVIDESVAICRYVESQYPEPNLFGTSPIETARIEGWERRVERDGFYAVASAFREAVPQFANRAAPGSAPNLPQIAELAQRGRILTQRFLDELNGHFAGSRFVAGDRYSIADITALVTVDFAKWVKIRISEEHVHTRRWYEEVSSRPSAQA